MEKWKNSFNFVELGRNAEWGATSLGSTVLMKDILTKDKGHFSEASDSGNIFEGSKESIKEHLDNINGRLVYRYIGDENSFNSHIWIWEESLVEISFSSPTYASCHVMSQDEQFLHDFRSFMKKHWQPAIKKGHIFAITAQGGRLALSNIGNAGIPLVEFNYEENVLADYKYIVKDLNSSSPSGRISIMEGEPGTGKTHLVRAMLMDVPNAMFVLVSPDMVSSLGGPELLPLLMNQRGSATGPIVLILEDADKCLIVRGGDNINSIQSLLNLGDGILGSLLDLRIIATTNAKKLEMEPAILRPGRICRRMEVGPLSVKAACNIFSHLLPEVAVPIELSQIGTKHLKKFTLAEVYSMARKYGWEPGKREEEEKVSDPRPKYADEDEDY